MASTTPRGAGPCTRCSAWAEEELTVVAAVTVSDTCELLKELVFDQSFDGTVLIPWDDAEALDAEWMERKPTTEAEGGRAPPFHHVAPVTISVSLYDLRSGEPAGDKRTAKLDTFTIPPPKNVNRALIADMRRRVAGREGSTRKWVIGTAGLHALSLAYDPLTHHIYPTL